MFALELKAVSKSFGALTVLQDFTCTVAPGAFTVLHGPSGCGKTTLLRLIAGLEVPDRGALYLQGRCASGNGAYLPPHRRGLAMAFQDFALWPHLTVEQHLDFVLRAAGKPRALRRETIASLLALMQFEDKRTIRHATLSGGQQQRLNLARALAIGAPLLLLDEPFAHLDAALQERILAELLRLKQQDGTTIVLAAHEHETLLAHADITLALPPTPPPR
ncbi:MAG: ATP-binding cassette domain-containing protein [Candidatus Hydrogenedentes bacterium]|nr:ATP-binding cassette domain-containing protein [Candidatus Hydrogenedentota bacterium]